MRLYQLYLLIVIFNLSCNKYPDDVSQSLKMAKGNRAELEKVLDHYGKNPNDSLKLKAALFLMKSLKYRFIPYEIVDVNEKYMPFFLHVDSAVKHVLKNMIKAKERERTLAFERIPTKEKIKNSINNGDGFEIKKKINLELQTITSLQIIEHIETAFLIWKKSKYAKGISFEQFLNTILGFRNVGALNESNIKEYNDVYYNFFNDTSVTNLNSAMKLFRQYLDGIRIVMGESSKNKRELGIYDILRMLKLDCPQRAVLYTKILNASGIPTYVDFTPQWADQIGGIKHYWCTIIDEDNKEVPISFGREELYSEKINSQLSRSPKVYRYSMEANEQNPSVLYNGNEFVPSTLRNPYFLDVTDRYFPTINLSVKLDVPKGRNQTCYLATFNVPRWIPVAYTDMSKEARFKKVKTGLVYAVGYYKNDEFKLLSQPFYVDNSGNELPLKANHDECSTIICHQKYKQKWNMLPYAKRIQSAELQASNYSDFKEYDVLEIIREVPEPRLYTIKLNEKRKFRFVRFYNKNSWLNLAELHFFSKNTRYEDKNNKSPFIVNYADTSLLNENKRLKILEGKWLKKWVGNGEIHVDEKINEKMKLCQDNNMETYSSGYFALDLGKPVNIKEVRFAVRNANNWVNVGNRYKLLYYDNGWKEHSTQKAKYNFLEFENVPSQTMYWLRNLDEGKEEQAFLYWNGKQYFVNTDDLSEIPWLCNK